MDGFVIPELIRRLFIGKVKIQGQLPEGRFLIASNHTSWADMFILSMLAPKMMAHKSITRIMDPLTLGSFSRLGCYEANIETTLELLKSQSVAICPEGWAWCDGVYTRPFKWGAVVIAQQADVQIVPVHIQYGWYPGFWINSVPNRWLVFLVCALLQLFFHRGVVVKIGKPNSFTNPVDLRLEIVKLGLTDITSG